MALSWRKNPRYLTKKARESVKATVMSATLRSGEEQFEIYFQEYVSCGWIDYEFGWQDEGNLLSVTLDNPYEEKRKAFFEHELAHPRLNYTDHQIEYIKKMARK